MVKKKNNILFDRGPGSETNVCKKKKTTRPWDLLLDRGKKGVADCGCNSRSTKKHARPEVSFKKNPLTPTETIKTQQTNRQTNEQINKHADRQNFSLASAGCGRNMRGNKKRLPPPPTSTLTHPTTPTPRVMFLRDTQTKATRNRMRTKLYSQHANTN